MVLFREDVLFGTRSGHVIIGRIYSWKGNYCFHSMRSTQHPVRTSTDRCEFSKHKYCYSLKQLHSMRAVIQSRVFDSQGSLSPLLIYKLGVYVGKTENHRGLTYINEVCEKRYLSQIDSVCEEHSASTFWKIIRSYGLWSKKYKPTYDCSYVPKWKILIFQFWVK